MARAKKRTTVKKATKKPNTEKTTAPGVELSEAERLPYPAKRNALKHKRVLKHERLVRTPLLGAPRLFLRSCRVLTDNWKLFSILLAAYAVLYVLLVGGLSAGNLSAVKSSLVSGHANNVTTGTRLFSALLSSGNNGNTVAGVYQTFLLLVMSLVLIWALRQLYAGRIIRARDAFYKGTGALIPFTLVLLVVALELLPLIIGGGLYNLVVGGGIVQGFFQVAVVVLLSLLLAVLSLYWICSSVVALYIVTLPDMTPLHALRSARQLVHFRRWAVLRKMLFLPFALLVVSALVLIPLASFATSLAVVVFFGLTIVSVAVLHSYMYTLYRELL